MEWAYVIVLSLEIILLAVCAVTTIIEAIDPASKAFEKVRIYVFVATLTLFPVVIHFFGLLCNFALIWEMVSEIPNVIMKMVMDILHIMIGCAALQ